MEEENILEELLKSPSLLDEIDLDEIVSKAPANSHPYLDYNVALDIITSPSKGTPSKIDDAAQELLAQIHDEVVLEKKHGLAETPSRQEDWARRIADLGSVSISAEATKNIANLGSVLGKAPPPVKKEDLIDETDGWCCICNEDGAVTCAECDDDVYCLSCFREGHQDGEFRKHMAEKLVRK
ncbi:Abscission/NoCut checkpoint regulator [Kappamyces sp. JEL0829]|nr:Abscission/NoCut checkpoint regulator [Kappamyces sp. JEL0829]KAJ3370184.1 Abscission/NoCut checkpoint regulator [Kappamyces sp. JEL0680]